MEVCEPGAEILSESLEEGVITGRFINDHVEGVEVVLQVLYSTPIDSTIGVCVSKRWSFSRELMNNS